MFKDAREILRFLHSASDAENDSDSFKGVSCDTKEEGELSPVEFSQTRPNSGFEFWVVLNDLGVIISLRQESDKDEKVCGKTWNVEIMHVIDHGEGYGQKQAEEDAEDCVIAESGDAKLAQDMIQEVSGEDDDTNTAAKLHHHHGSLDSVFSFISQDFLT